jgi:signal transduction histidine kinase
MTSWRVWRKASSASDASALTSRTNCALPLAAIRSTSEVALKWPEQASPEDHAGIARLAARLQETVDGLLVLARAEALSAEVVREEVALRPLVEECVALHAERAREREVTLTAQLDAAAGLQTDARLLTIIVTNLIANAVEHAPPRSEVTIACHAADRLFEVINAAPSLTAEDVPHLFERLWRKDAARSDESHAGLGLSLAQSCAQALGLALTAELTAELDASGLLTVSVTSPQK